MRPQILRDENQREVREFARLNPSPVPGAPGSEPSGGRFGPDAGDSPEASGNGARSLSGGQASTSLGVELQAPTLEEAEAGMEEMSRRFEEAGGELYIGAVARERD